MGKLFFATLVSIILTGTIVNCIIYSHNNAVEDAYWQYKVDCYSGGNRDAREAEHILFQKLNNLFISEQVDQERCRNLRKQAEQEMEAGSHPIAIEPPQ